MKQRKIHPIPWDIMVDPGKSRITANERTKSKGKKKGQVMVGEINGRVSRVILYRTVNSAGSPFRILI